MDDDEDRRAYGALSRGSYREHDGVVGEWQFDERRPQQKLDVVVPLADTTEAGTHYDMELLEEDKDDADALTARRRREQEEQAEQEAFLNAWSRFLFSKRGLGLVLLMLASLALGVLALVYREELFRAFDRTAGFIRDQGTAGSVLLILAVAITCYPPLIGYSWCLFACGYIYGWAGFIPAYIGALLGGLTSFLAFRYAFRDWVEKQTRSYPKYVALERALEKEGLPLLILIRIAPYPYPIFNALFAATRVQFHIYAIGTAIALIKILIHISIGKSLSNFSDVIHGGAGSWWDLGFLIFGVVVGIAVGVYLYFRTREHLQHYADEIGETPPYGQADDFAADDEESAQDLQLTSLRPADVEPKQQQQHEEDHTDGEEEGTNAPHQEDDAKSELAAAAAAGEHKPS